MPPPLVCVSVNYGLAYGRDVARGALDVAKAVHGWAVTLPQPISLATEIDRIHPVGLIVQATEPHIVEAVRARNIPTVNVADNFKDHPFPCVFSDHMEIGARAATHLLDRGLCHFAYCGPAGHWYAEQRRIGFAKALRDANVPGTVELLQPLENVLSEDDLRPWFDRLGRPVGVLVANDHWATVVIEVARRHGLRVPEDVAVIGVDNDELLCESAEVPLSSVDVDGKGVGRTAVDILSQMLEGCTDVPRLTRVRPLDVVARRSTDLMATDDPLVVDALAFMRQHAAEPIGVEDVLNHMAISRRQLEKRFRHILGRTPAAEIRRLRVERARELIQSTEKPLSDIATLCGFNDLSMLGKAFRRETGLTPSEYRLRQTRGK